MPARGADNRVYTFLFTDIEDSSGQWLRHPDAYLGAQRRHFELLHSAVKEQGGEVFKHVGDACCAAFVSPLAAVQAAIGAQVALRAEPWQAFGTDFRPLRVRMAVHSCVAHRESGDYHGAELTTIARLMEHPAGGQIIVSQATEQLVHLLLPANIALRPLREVPLEGLNTSIHIFDVLWAGELPQGGAAPASDEAALDEVAAQISAGQAGHVRPELLGRLVRRRPRDFAEYRKLRLVEWALGPIDVDRRFVRLRLLRRADEREQDAVRAGPDDFNDLRRVLTDPVHPVHVVIGPPGSGKSTLLRRLELDLAVDGLEGRTDDVTFLLPLNSYTPPTPPLEWLTNRWAARQPDLPPLDAIVGRGQLVLLLDGLNEMPHANDAAYRAAVGVWRRFMAEMMRDHPGNHVILSCRSLDYSAPLSTEDLQVPQVVIQPMDDATVRQFLRLHCPDQAADLWFTLAAGRQLELMRTPYILSLLAHLVQRDHKMPESTAALFTAFVRDALQREIQRQNARFEPGAVLSVRDHARAALNANWPSEYALPSEGSFDSGLSNLAFGMQYQREMIEVAQVRLDHATALKYIAEQSAPEVLEAGIDLGILTEDPATDEVLFRHQLLQEYFAARSLARRPQPSLARVEWRAEALRPSLDETLRTLGAADPLPPPPATGWEETMVLAATMAGDPANFVQRLAATNLALAARCAAEPGVAAPEPLRQALRQALVARTRDPAADLRARIAAGLALGQLGDPRLERRTGPYGPYLLPPIVAIPAGEYPVGSDEGIYDEEAPAHTVTLAPFQIAAVPVSNAEWALFMAAGGYENAEWWDTPDARAWRQGEGTADGSRWSARLLRAQHRQQPGALDEAHRQGEITDERYQELRQRAEMSDEAFEDYVAAAFRDERFVEPMFWRDGSFADAAQPVVGISWYEARAYCQWIAAQTGLRFRLPTEMEWEAAARGPGGLRFAFGDAFRPDCCNSYETHVRRTTPIGVFPAGDTPTGLIDMTGNTFDWTSSAYGPEAGRPLYAYPYRDDGREDATAPRHILRVARGGAWGFGRRDCRSACRYWNPPMARNDVIGLRLACSPSP